MFSRNKYTLAKDVLVRLRTSEKSLRGQAKAAIFCKGRNARRGLESQKTDEGWAEKTVGGELGAPDRTPMTIERKMWASPAKSNMGKVGSPSDAGSTARDCIASGLNRLWICTSAPH